MDRQHSRDLFDILGLYAEEGITPEIVECFVCYLAGHNRPVHEVLFANKKDITSSFTNKFEGMSRNQVSLEDLINVRQRLFSELLDALEDRQKNFLRGLWSKASPIDP